MKAHSRSLPVSFFFWPNLAIFDKEIGKILDFLKSENSTNLFLFQKKFKIVDIKKKRKEKRSTDPSLLQRFSTIYLFC
jgi:hypothetical protein